MSDTNTTHNSSGSTAAFIVYAATFALLTTGGTIPIPLYGLWGADLGFGSSTITWIFAVYVLGTLLALVAFGGLSDQIGRRPLLIGAMAATLASAALFLWAGSVPALLLARLLSGFGVGLITSAATAGLAEAYTGPEKSTPQVVSTVVNMGGLGLGPLVAGLMAQYLPAPTTLVFVVFTVAAVVATVAVLRLPETNPRATSHATFRLNVGGPRDALGVYWLSAAAVFPTFTLLGLFSSLTPRFIRDELGVHNLAVAGAATFVLFEIGVLAQLWSRRRSAPASVRGGLPLVIASLLFVLFGVTRESATLFALGTVVGGVGAGLTFSGALRQLGASVAHENHAKSVATYFVAAQSGLAVPVLLIGWLSSSMSLSAATNVVLVVVIVLAALALVANVLGRRLTAEAAR